jgi:hypothetical protein
VANAMALGSDTEDMEGGGLQGYAEVLGISRR